MPYFRIDPSSAPDWSPLERVTELTGSSPGLHPLDPADFMYMGCAHTADGLRLHLYKHRDSRRYLNLDDQGHAYRYTGERDASGHDREVSYERLPDLRAALAWVVDLPATGDPAQRATAPT